MENPLAIDDRRQIQRLLPRHFQIIEMHIAGHENTAIAEALGTSRSNVNLVLKSPLVQAEVSRRRQEAQTEVVMGLDRMATMGKARSILEEASVTAAATHVKHLGAEDLNVQHRAANAILDRVFGKGQDHGGPATVVNISAEHVQLLNVALREARELKGVNNVADELQPANLQAANPSENGSSDVCKGTEGTSEGNGHCPAEAQGLDESLTVKPS